MFQLCILSGNQAGTKTVAGRLPFWMGRSPQDDLRLEAPGIWERHARLELQGGNHAALVAGGEAMVLVNGQAVREAPLRIGDIIELGPVRLEFGLSPARHRGLRWREALIWIGLGLLSLGQVTLIYWLASLE